MIEIMMELKPDGKRALYEQIYEYIRNEIADGKISQGEKLPSTRLLAGNLSVSRSTVELAYEQLVSEGYVETRPCSGYYVCDIMDIYKAGSSEEAEPVAVEEKKEYRYDFSPYMVDLKYFPYNAWRKINKNVLLEEEKLFRAGNASGEEALRREVTRYLHQARGVNCEPGQVVIGAGNEYLLLLLAQILGTDQKVVMENPTYLQAYRTFCNMHYTVFGVPMDKDGISFQEVQKHEPDIVYTMPSHQYPLGIVMPLKRRMELLGWAAAHPERYIIEDDHDSEFRYKGKPIPSLQGNDKTGSVIYLGTLSKSIAPALRISYMVLPKRLLKKYHENCGFYASTVAKVQQEVLARFMREGYFERHLNRMRGIYRAKHDRMSQELKKQTWVHKIYGDNAGLHFLVEVETKASEEELVETGKAHGIRLYGLSANYIGKREGRGWPTLLIGYGSLPEDEMKESVMCITDVIKQIEEKNKKI